MTGLRQMIPSSAPAVPAPVKVVRLPRRRQWGLVALGVVLVAVCAVVAYLLVVTAGLTRPYLAVRRDLPYGAVIGADDLMVVNINPASGLKPLPAGQRGQVVGRHAATRLVAGTLLTSAQVIESPVPAAGQQVVGIELKPAQVPVRTLRPGSEVLLVIVPPAGLVGASDPQPSTPARPDSVRATVVACSGPAAGNGNVRVDAAVAQADGPLVAAMAAAGRIAVVVTARG